MEATITKDEKDLIDQINNLNINETKQTISQLPTKPKEEEFIE
jgi:hypothetical protein